MSCLLLHWQQRLAEHHISLPKPFSSGDVKNGSGSLISAYELMDERQQQKQRSYPRCSKRKLSQFG